MFGQPHLPSLLSMKCLKTTGPIVSSALRVLTFKIVDGDFYGEYEGNDDDNDDEDSNQVLNVGVHHGKPCALRVVAVLKERNSRHHHYHLVMIMNIDTTLVLVCDLHSNENVSSRANDTQHLREGRGVDLACNGH